MKPIAAVAADLKREAELANERRILVCAGERGRGIDAAYDAIEGADVDDSAVTMVSTREGFRFEALRPRGADDLLGRTRELVVLDCHEQFVPNALGRVTGAVDGGGLLVLVTPPLEEWPDTRDRFDESLAVPPFDVAEVTGRFRARLVRTLRTLPGIAIVDVDGAEPTDGTRTSDGTRSSDGMGASGAEPAPTVERDGRTDPEPWSPRSPPSTPTGATFPAAAYESCLTDDQSRALRALERLATPGSAVVVEADRGRGKSSAAGLAAGSLALAGRDVLVTAPAFDNATELFARARELLAGADAIAADVDESEPEPARTLRSGSGGRVRFRSPPDAAAAVATADPPDVAIVDEAAALPVRLLDRLLAAPSIAFCTTVHGYEGAGRGFSVRFREHLTAADHAVRDVRLDEPIRYADADPVEGWAFRALLLDARPPVDAAVADVTAPETTYRALGPDELLADEHLLSAVFGLLIAAHYRTEPNDLARLLDAPNLSVRALLADGNVVAVALLAREGGLSAAVRRRMYEGERVRGNMVPDLLTSQLRDETAGEPAGIRTVRLATHHAVRDRGLGSRLLDRIHAEFGDAVDYFSVGYGATPRLLRFWRRAGYRTVHLSTTRNDASGEHSAIMLRPASAAGTDLLARHATAFCNRERDALSDAHRDVDPDVVRGALRACDAPVDVDLTDHEWRAVVGAADGPGMYDAAPGAFRDLAIAALVGPDDDRLDERSERLLVRKVLQGRPWDEVADELGYASTRTCMRGVGDAAAWLVDRYGTAVAAAERDRFTRE